MLIVRAVLRLQHGQIHKFTHIQLNVLPTPPVSTHCVRTMLPKEYYIASRYLFSLLVINYADIYSKTRCSAVTSGPHEATLHSIAYTCCKQKWTLCVVTFRQSTKLTTLTKMTKFGNDKVHEEVFWEIYESPYNAKYDSPREAIVSWCLTSLFSTNIWLIRDER